MANNPLYQPAATEIYEPTDPIDPTSCPTCRSGTPPRDPWYDDAIDPAPEG